MIEIEPPTPLQLPIGAFYFYCPAFEKQDTTARDRNGAITICIAVSPMQERSQM